MAHKIFDNNLVTIRKNKVTLMLITHSIMITLKINMATTMSIKILATIKKCLTLVIIQLNQNIMIIQKY